MISGCDHIVIAVREIGAATTAYEALLHRKATPPETTDGVSKAVIVLDNIAVELMAPEGDGEAARRLSAALEDGEGLKSLVFATDNLESAHRRCERLGLKPEPIKEAVASRSFRLNTERTDGARLFVMQRNAPLIAFPPDDASVLGLDHIVVQSGDMERAAALYGARLGLDMRLDREVGGRRLIFFRCGAAVLEVAHDPGRDGDTLWGVSWRVANADTAHARLQAAGLDVSNVRAGMKPGTRVFTVRGGTCGVPTLMIEQAR